MHFEAQYWNADSNDGADLSRASYYIPCGRNRIDREADLLSQQRARQDEASGK